MFPVNRPGLVEKGCMPGAVFFSLRREKPLQCCKMTNFSYRTIAKPAEGQYKEKGSRFLAFAYPVASEGEIKERLEKIRKKYFDARHHCFAWVLGADRRLFRAFDDGEPNHSAGDPILGQLRSKELTYVLIVVVRYFGGVKLGAGGLITAYKTAAAEALNHAEIIEKEVVSKLKIVYDYAATAEVTRLIKEFDLGIRSQNFEADCCLIADYKMRDHEKLFERMKWMKAMGVKVSYE
jgi:uncharacterized YigZ family protein